MKKIFFFNVKDLLWLLLTFCVTLLNHIKTAEKSDQMYFYVHRFGRFLFLFFLLKRMKIPENIYFVLYFVFIVVIYTVISHISVCLLFFFIKL